MYTSIEGYFSVIYLVYTNTVGEGSGGGKNQIGHALAEDIKYTARPHGVEYCMCT